MLEVRQGPEGSMVERVILVTTRIEKWEDLEVLSKMT